MNQGSRQVNIILALLNGSMGKSVDTSLDGELDGKPWHHAGYLGMLPDNPIKDVSQAEPYRRATEAKRDVHEHCIHLAIHNHGAYCESLRVSVYWPVSSPGLDSRWSSRT